MRDVIPMWERTFGTKRGRGRSMRNIFVLVYTDIQATAVFLLICFSSLFKYKLCPQPKIMSTLAKVFKLDSSFFFLRPFPPIF